MRNTSGRQVGFYMLGSIIASAGVMLQLYVTMQDRQLSVLLSLIRFLSYFTILTNLLVACYFITLWFFNKSKLGLFFNQYATTTALNVYILVVGLVYNSLLRQTWNPQGIAKLADETLHTIVPLFFLTYWLFGVKRERIAWNAANSWVIYPLGYSIYTIIRGSITNTYPYPFIDVTQLGYPRALLNCVGIALVFYLLSLFFIWVSRQLVKQSQ